MNTNATVSTHEEIQPSSETRVVQHFAAAVASRIIGQGPQIVRTGSAVAEVIPSRAPVLLVGAPGTGK
jgi:transcriptional regulator with AAA-type ATPase domain